MTEHEMTTFRRPDKAGFYLWSCTCGESGLNNNNGDPYTNRQGADSGGRQHVKAQEPTAPKRSARQSSGIITTAEARHLRTVLFQPPPAAP